MLKAFQIKSLITVILILATVLNLKSQSNTQRVSLVINPITSCSATMNWNSVSGATYYRVRYRIGLGAWSPLINVGANLTYTYSGLLPSTAYTFKFSAYSATNQFLMSKNTTVSTLACSVPFNVSVSNVQLHQATVKWTGGVCNSNSYHVAYKISTDSIWNVLTVTSIDSVVLTNLTEEKNYQVKVSGLCANGSYSDYTTPQSFKTTSRPNVILILTDDMTWGNYTPNGGNAVAFNQSPNIDRIANEGVNFQNTFATYSLCIPSRATIFTGLYSHKNGATNNYDTLDGGITTIAEIMHSYGYTTGFVGKYHMTAQKQPGWDYWFSFPNVSRYYDPYGNINGRDTVFVGQYLTDVINNLSMYFLDSVVTPDKPFFLICAQVAPHDPFDARLQDDSLYLTTTVPLPTNFYSYTQNYPSYLSDPHHYYQKGPTKNQEEIRNYYEMLPGINDGAGMIFNYLASRNITDSTLLMFMSDNGYLFGEHKLYRKRLPYEESIKVPLFIRYPKWFANDTVVTDKIALNIDIAPTILDAALIPNTYNMDGVSLRLLYNDSIQRHEFMYEYIYYTDYPNTPSIRAVRDMHYKYIKSYCANNVEQFFDLVNDPHENTNLINTAAYQTLINTYRYKLDSFMVALNDNFTQDPNPVNCTMQNSVYNKVENDLVLDDELEGPQKFIIAYPSPCNDQTTLRLNFPGGGNYKVQIINVLGQNVYSNSDNTEVSTVDLMLNTKSWNPGTYLISVTMNDEKFNSNVSVIH